MDSLTTTWGRYKPALYMLVLILAAAWIWMSRLPANRANPNTAPARGFRAPDFTLVSQDGAMVQLSDLRGQTVLINFWASWCPPCPAEMPAMEGAYQQYQAQGFVILAINSTIQDERAEAEALIEELELTFPILWDEDGSVTQAYQVNSLPTSFFVDPEGIIQEVIIGGPMAEALLMTRVGQILQSTSRQFP